MPSSCPWDHVTHVKPREAEQLPKGPEILSEEPRLNFGSICAIDRGATPEQTVSKPLSLPIILSHVRIPEG